MKSLRQAVILAGGQGTRLRPLTLTTPKPLIPIHGKPFAEYLVDLLKKNGIKEIIFLTGYLSEQFPAYFGDGSKFGISIKYSESALEDETGTRLRKAKPLLDEQFLLLYGDNFWPLNLEKLLTFHQEKKILTTVTVYERQDKEKKNNMLVEGGMVTIYDKKREIPGLSGVDIGFFILSRSVLDLIPEDNVNFEKAVLPQLIEKKQLAGFLTKQPYWGLTDAERLSGVARALDPNRKVVFLDRDGTLNVRAPKGNYVTRREEFIFLPGTLEALEKLVRAGYEMYIISNQSGIARGIMTEDDLSDIHAYMREELKKKGIVLSGIYYCPHGWDSTCECRKPKPGMLLQAAREHDIDLSRSLFIGDDDRDGQAAQAAGVPFIQVSSDIGIVGALSQLIL